MDSEHITHYLMGSSVDPTCHDCGQAKHTMEHWLLNCSTLTEAQTDISGRRGLSLNALRTSRGNVFC